MRLLNGCLLGLLAGVGVVQAGPRYMGADEAGRWFAAEQQSLMLAVRPTDDRHANKRPHHDDEQQEDSSRTTITIIIDDDQDACRKYQRRCSPEPTGVNRAIPRTSSPSLVPK